MRNSVVVKNGDVEIQLNELVHITCQLQIQVHFML